MSFYQMKTEVEKLTGEATSIEEWKQALILMVKKYGADALYCANCDLFTKEGDVQLVSLPYDERGVCIEHTYLENAQYCTYIDNYMSL